MYSASESGMSPLAFFEALLRADLSTVLSIYAYISAHLFFITSMARLDRFVGSAGNMILIPGISA